VRKKEEKKKGKSGTDPFSISRVLKGGGRGGGKESVNSETNRRKKEEEEGQTGRHSLRSFGLGYSPGGKKKKIRTRASRKSRFRV